MLTPNPNECNSTLTRGNFTKIKTIMYFANFLNAFVKPRNVNFSQNKLYIWNLQITRFKMIYDMLVF